MAAWDRLTGLDATFLELEDGNAHMHIGATMVFEPGPLVGADGRLDIERIRRAVAAKLHLVARYRQKLAYVPLEGHPVWVDDDQFNLEYHVRLTALPYPGGPDELKRLTARIMSQMLDRGKPLWEIWIVEGLQSGGFAMINKTHHCMVDGISGSDIISTLLDPDPRLPTGRPQAWKPRPTPHAVNLTADAVRHRLEQPLELLRATRRAITNPITTLREAQAAVQSVAQAVAPGLTKASETPFNVPIGPHRQMEWTSMPLAQVKAVKDALGGTVNDVVLATVAGAVRRYFRYRRVPVRDLDFRVMIPVSVRTKGEEGALGNRVSLMVAPLPIGLKSAVERLHAIIATTKDLKRSKQAVGAERLTSMAEWAVPNLMAQAARLVTRARAFNLVVTNVPGPQVTLYLEGARMVASYPVVPLTHNMACGVALFSYDGTLYWGLNGDWDAMADMDRLIRFVGEAFDELQTAAEHVSRRETATPAPPARKRKPRRKKVEAATAANRKSA